MDCLSRQSISRVLGSHHHSIIIIRSIIIIMSFSFRSGEYTHERIALSNAIYIDKFELQKNHKLLKFRRTRISQL